LKAETDINVSITESLIGRTMILVIMYVKTFKADVVFIGIKHHNMTSLRPIISSIRVNPLIMTITLVEIKGKMSNLPKVESIYLEPVYSHFLR
jgi:hypothetical protein